MYSFIKTDLTTALPLYEKYAAQINSGDDFWEEHIYKGDIYNICLDNNTIGIFSVYNNERLSSFYLFEPFVKDAQNIFALILSEFDIKSAFVVTADELFLSLALDKHKEIKPQAYFFSQGVAKAADAQHPREWLKKATKADLPELIATKFFDDEEKRVEDQTLYVMRNESGDFLGAGISEPLRIRKNHYATGMYTNPDFREQGVGRSIIMHIKSSCLEEGKIPVAGCWYFNHLSKRTLESTGYVTKTRLLNILF